jgi:hypothetical protein
MFAHIVSPPTGGHSTQRSTQPNGGAARHVASVCQAFSYRSIVRLVGRLVDAHEPRMLGIAARNRMIFEVAESPGERHVFRARERLIPQEEHAVLEQRGADLAEQGVVMNGVGQIEADEFGADRAGEGFDLQVSLPPR